MNCYKSMTDTIWIENIITDVLLAISKYFEYNITTHSKLTKIMFKKLRVGKPYNKRDAMCFYV